MPHSGKRKMPVGSAQKNLPVAAWYLLGSLYVTQYLGLGFFLVSLVAILRAGGASLERVSVIYLLGLVWALKFLWAPLVDRVGFAWAGHFRGWLLLMQGGMVLTLLAIGSLDPVSDFFNVFMLCLLLAFFSATQDIATDGLACLLLTQVDRGVGNGLQVAGGLLGNLMGAGGVLMVYPYFGWQGSIAILAAGTMISLVQVVLFREPVRHVRTLPVTSVIRRIWTIWQFPEGGLWLLMLLFYPMGVSLGYALITPILVDAGWALDRIGFVVNVIGSLFGIPSALATGYLIRRYGLRPVMIGAALFQIPGILALLVPVQGQTGELAVMAAVGLYFLFYNPVVAVISTLMMEHSSLESPATDYSLQYSMYMLFSIVAVAAGTALAGRVGYLPELGLAASFGLAMVYLSFRYNGPQPCLDDYNSNTVGPEARIDSVNED